MAKFNKHYSTITEYTAKFEIFRANFIHTAKKLSMNKNHKVGVTKFFDMTPAEFKSIYRNLKFKDIKTVQPHQRAVLDLSTPTPASYDWRAHGAVGPIKNQEQCGSCWLSLPSETLKVKTPSSITLYKTSQNNKLLIAM